MLNNKQIALSIVTTVYKSLSFLPQFIDNTIKTLQDLNEVNFEIIFVIDGDTDDSLFYLEERKKEIPQIKIVELSRNFGHHYAISAGLNECRGDVIFLIDCDLEVLPESLVLFQRELNDNKDLDVVYGYQTKRKGNVIEREFGRVFWKLFNFLTEVEIPVNIVTERLMTRRYLDSLIQMGDKNLFMGGMMYWIGYNQKGIEIKKNKRIGKSSYSIYKRVNLLFEAITSFSEKPLKVIFHIGLFISFISTCMSLFFLGKKIIYPESILMGYTSMVLLISFLFGVLILSIGIAGIYIARVFKQVQNRPLYIIKSIIE